MQSAFAEDTEQLNSDSGFLDPCQIQHENTHMRIPTWENTFYKKMLCLESIKQW